MLFCSPLNSNLLGKFKGKMVYASLFNSKQIDVFSWANSKISIVVNFGCWFLGKFKGKLMYGSLDSIQNRLACLVKQIAKSRVVNFGCWNSSMELFLTCAVALVVSGNSWIMSKYDCSSQFWSSILEIFYALLALLIGFRFELLDASKCRQELVS